jgi:hypothetical protein
MVSRKARLNIEFIDRRQVSKLTGLDLGPIRGQIDSANAAHIHL